MTELNLPPGVPIERMAEMQHFAQSIGLVLVIRCSQCGQPLFDPKSISLGLGPVCRAKAQNDPSSSITVAKRSAATEAA